MLGQVMHESFSWLIETKIALQITFNMVDWGLTYDILRSKDLI